MSMQEALILAAGALVLIFILATGSTLWTIFGRVIKHVPLAVWECLKDWSLTAVSPVVVAWVAIKQWFHQKITHWLFKR